MSTTRAARIGTAEAIERPAPGGNAGGVWGSDVVASCLRALDIPYVCLNPGASFRGLHDSLVNYLGNTAPQMLLCLHEEHAVAIAHGYAKVTGRPLGAIVHSNVGLMHGSMAVFNAWCDRVPLVLLGATGPVDATRRRPWIDWIHTARDQGALVRSFLKWDDQPASIGAAQESMLRAHMLATTAPCGPVYICLDTTLQEMALQELPPEPEVARYRAPLPAAPAPDLIARAAKLLAEAERPVILMGRVSRDTDAWRRRVELAELLHATVLTDLKQAAAFPTDHPLHGPPPSVFPQPAMIEVLRAADVVLSLDWTDLAGTLKAAWKNEKVRSKVIQASVDQHVHNGWSMDHQGLPPVDLFLLNEPDTVVPPLLAALRPLAPRPRALPEHAAAPSPALPASGPIDVPTLGLALRAALEGEDVAILRVPLSWNGGLWPFRHPLDFLGYDGGAGIGSGPGMSVGMALALKGSGRMPVAILGDGDYLMGVTALWTAAHYDIPLLIVVANNRSYFNDELHQERVARERSRPVANRWIGQAIKDPDIDIAQMARAQGLAGIGPVENADQLAAAFLEAIATVRGGRGCVVDIRVQPGYDAGMAAALAREARKS
jgi:thiamine pyrophosphate-dependent acetolactate synthase large subunit-like protein